MMNLRHKTELLVVNNGCYLKWIDSGIGYLIKDTVYLNENLLKHPNLLKLVVWHELRHKRNDGDRIQDFVLDFLDPSIWLLLGFMFRYPRACECMLPIKKIDNYMTYDVNIIIFWVIFVIGVILFGFVL